MTTDFHDITSGSNGYSATTGYDLATGWGSPNGSGLINALAGTASGPGFSLSASPTSVSVSAGQFGNLHHHQHRDGRLRFGRHPIRERPANGSDRRFQPDLDYRDWNFHHDDDCCLVHSHRHL